MNTTLSWFWLTGFKSVPVMITDHFGRFELNNRFGSSAAVVVVRQIVTQKQMFPDS